MLGKIKSFWEESRREFKRVNWPNRAETMRFTIFVIVFSLAVAALLGLLDFVFFRAVETLVL